MAEETATDIRTRLFNREDDHDIVLVRGQKRIYAHRAILRSGSGHFQVMLDQNRGFVEGNLSIITLHDDDEDSFERIIKHIYGFPYKHKPNTPKAFATVATDYTTANKYIIPDLEAHTLALAEREMKPVNGSMLPLVRAVKYVYSSANDCPRRLMLHVRSSVDFHFTALLHSKAFICVMESNLDVAAGFFASYCEAIHWSNDRLHTLLAKVLEVNDADYAFELLAAREDLVVFGNVGFAVFGLTDMLQDPELRCILKRRKDLCVKYILRQNWPMYNPNDDNDEFGSSVDVLDPLH